MENRKQFYVCFDEYERNDMFVLVAAIVPFNKATALLKEWKTLRENIKAHLMLHYPNVRIDKRLQNDLLPEIHAVELFQSSGYYRKYKYGQHVEGDAYWLQHYAWLEDALKIIEKYEVSFSSYRAKRSDFEDFPNEAHALLDKIQEIVSKLGFKRKIYAKRAENALRNPYVYGLSQMLLHLEYEFRSKKQQGFVICDDHSMSKGFSTDFFWNWMEQRQHYVSLTRPSFHSSLDNALLQVADVLCYIKGRKESSEAEGKVLQAPLDVWYDSYIQPAAQPLLDVPDQYQQHLNLFINNLVCELAVTDKTILKVVQDDVQKTHLEKFKP